MGNLDERVLCRMAKERRDEGLCHDVDWRYLVQVKAGLLTHRALHRRHRNLEQSARNGQLLFLHNLLHQVRQPAERRVDDEPRDAGVAAAVQQRGDSSHRAAPQPHGRHALCAAQVLHHHFHIVDLICSQRHIVALRKATPRKVECEDGHPQRQQDPHRLLRVAPAAAVAVAVDDAWQPSVLAACVLWHKVAAHKLQPLLVGQSDVVAPSAKSTDAKSAVQATDELFGAVLVPGRPADAVAQLSPKLQHRAARARGCLSARFAV
mmetsp:Transcript_30499/g.90436  ORF Transcript_30499/g.90436 Transcript_30499/m.90436 type:complete len:264 (-) Transcript_30499:252-1043(-)